MKKISDPLQKKDASKRRQSHKGFFKPRHPEKYKGDPTQIVYRSSWELKLMNYFDQNGSILQWCSEEIVIPYRIPYENKVRRYFPDFLIVARQKDGSTKRYLIEVKPDSQTRPPKVQKIKTKRYLQEVATWATNSSKWQAAEAWCEKHDIKFVKITEKNIGLFK